MDKRRRRPARHDPVNAIPRPLYASRPISPLAAGLAGLACLAGCATKPAEAPATGKIYELHARPETVQWGWLDPKEPPKLTIASGDVVAIETLMHAKDQIQKGTSMEQIVALRKSNPGGGPHSLTGPVYVEGAEPGDVLEIRILDIVPKKVGANFNLPGKDFPTVGALAPEFPEGFVRYFDLDWDHKQTEFKPGIVLPLRPFPGILAVGIDPEDPSPRKGGAKDPLAPVSTLRPWKNGSNMDINELTAGSTIYLPVFLKGGLIWTGDSHCAQGNGEVNLTALECSFEKIVLQPIVHKDMKLVWPRIETPTHYIQVGFDESLDKAMVIAVAETVDFLATQKHLDRYEAYSLTALAADCRVSQVVDIRKGVHCMVPKSIFVR
jgi:acetamidase/formamidase